MHARRRFTIGRNNGERQVYETFADLPARRRNLALLQRLSDSTECFCVPAPDAYSYVYDQVLPEIISTK